MVWPFDQLTAWCDARADKKAARFVATRENQKESADAFVAACRKGGVVFDREIMLGIRELIAELGRVDPIFIKSTDTYYWGLSFLPFWDSLDSVEIVLELEERFGVQISDRESEQMLPPELSSNCTVVDIIENWGNLVVRLRNSA